ncbi:MAG: type VI secretion system tip protein VgrG [Sandaracinaceae bacterium]|nr:type VI secretion system tip protein VgrG [Sandaracinaceae bacterium]
MSIDHADTGHRLETDLLAEPLVATELRIVEAFNEPYKIELVAWLPRGEAEGGVAALLGRDCTLRLQRPAGERVFRGLIRELHEGLLDPNGASLRLVIVPALWLLSLGKDSRIFQHMSVVEILGLVLGAELAKRGRTMLYVPGRAHPRREYCVQYQESSLDFVHRLMEEEGIAYTFSHDADRELLVLHDTNRGYLPVDAGAAGGFVPYEPHNLATAGVDAVTAFELRRRPGVNEVAIRDYDWTRPSPIVDAGFVREPEDPRRYHAYEHGLGRSLCLWDYQEGSLQYAMNDGPVQAVLRAEREAVGTLVGAGHGTVAAFSPGARFQLGGHPLLGADGEYLVTRVEHTAGAAAGEPEARGAETYSNRFECIPYGREHRPERRTRKPRIASIQTATVVGPAGEEIHTDPHGRIRVKLHWDRLHPADETGSCWIRVQQAWAGPMWGALFLPRVGMEVIVTFVDGDPDRPIVTGCLYNGANRPPYPLPEEKTKSTLKTRSSPGGNGYNELRFEDRAGAEEIWLHGQKDWNTVIENDVTERVGHDRQRLVLHDESVQIDGHHEQQVGGDRTRSVGGDEAVTVDGARRVRVAGAQEHEVGGRDALHVSGARGVHVTGAERHRVDASYVDSVGEHRVLRSTGQTWVRASKVTLEADEEILLKVGGAFIRLRSDKAHVEAHQTFLNSGEPAPDAPPPLDPDSGPDGSEEVE